MGRRGCQGQGLPQSKGGCRWRLTCSCQNSVLNLNDGNYSLRMPSGNHLRKPGADDSFSTLLAAESQGVFGLANGADQSNSIEFVVSGSKLTCKAIFGGTATSVSVTSTLSNTSYNQFQILATSTAVRLS